jgi:hypothetical protein
MRAVHVRVHPESPAWTVRVLWVPRHRALVRRFGGWGRRHSPDSGPGEPHVSDPGPWGADWDVASPPSNARTSSSSSPSEGDGGWLDGDFEGILVFALFVVVGLAVWFVAIPLALILVDAAALAVLLVGGILARVLLRRPWTVEAASSSGHRLTRRVVGYRNALRVRDEAAEGLRRGAFTA